MKPIIKVMQTVLVNHFYKLNAGFLAFFFFLFFGVVRGEQLIYFHVSLIKAFLASPVFLALVIIAWGLYTLKCADYIIKRILEPRQLFLTSINRLAPKKVWGWMLYTHLLIYMPVLLYVLIALSFAVHAHQWIQVIIITISNLAFIVSATQAYFRVLQQQSTESFIFKLNLPEPKFAKPLFAFPLYFLWHERKQMLLITKVFSFLVLYGFISFYEPDGYDIRPLLLIFLLISAAHMSMIYQIRFFENEFLLFTKNLPITLAKRFVQMLGLYLVLFSPELIYVYRAYPLFFSINDYPQLVLILLSLAAFFHSVLLTSDMKAEDFLKIVFGMLAVLFFLIFYNPGSLLFVFVLLIAFVFFYGNFYEFEKSNQAKEAKP